MYLHKACPRTAHAILRPILFRFATILTAVFRLRSPAQDVHCRLEFQPRLVFGSPRLPVRVRRL